MSIVNELDWRIRLHIYRHFVDHAQPPTYGETARAFDIDPEEARQAYRRLHEGHALFLEPGADTIRMANPLSAVPTPYLVSVNGRRLYANCAWDSLGIPAMLHADAWVEATTPLGTPMRYAVDGGRLQGDAGVAHILVPFRRWYDDLIHT